MATYKRLFLAFQIVRAEAEYFDIGAQKAEVCD
jgi:hypothetical protein